MTLPVRICGTGLATSRGEGEQVSDELAHRLTETLAGFSPGSPQARLFHNIEALAFLAAHDALIPTGIRLPLGGDGIGVVLGIEEGIDGIKARYYRALLTDGPLGASPIAFPYTAPNTIAARIAILLDLRGENVTVCGGTLSGAQAIGLAVESLREGCAAAVLAGGATAVGPDFLDALAHAGRPGDAQPGAGACLLLLEPQGSSDKGSGLGQLLGYAEGFGKDDLRDAIEACLGEAELSPDRIASVRVASAHDPRSVVGTLRSIGVSASILRSAASNMYSASFPMAVAEAASRAGGGPRGPVLVVGTDCLVGASAAVVREGSD